MSFILYGIGMLFLYPVSLLPFKAIYLLSDGLFLIIYYAFGYRRKVVARNLQSSFPNLGDKDLRSLEKAYFRHFCDLIFETIKCLTISKNQMRQRCVIKDLHILNEYHENGRGVVAVLGHFGNWEWAALSSALSVKQQMVVVYQPLTNKYFDNLINRIRTRFGVKMVAMKDVFRFYLENEKEVFVNCFVADQSPQNRKSVYWTNFLNQETAVTTGPEKIARKVDHAVIFVSLQKVKRGIYHLRMKKLTEKPVKEPENTITSMHVKELESQIIDNPQYWLWSHKRWKLPPPETLN